MVLQLVLPQGGTDNMKHEPPITPDYIQYGKLLIANHVVNLTYLLTHCTVQSPS
jgi:hypothetical protein